MSKKRQNDKEEVKVNNCNCEHDCQCSDEECSCMDDSNLNDERELLSKRIKELEEEEYKRSRRRGNGTARKLIFYSGGN